MRFDQVLKQDGGEVVCVENGATISITGKGDAKCFMPSFPENSPPLSMESFRQQYAAKHFEPGKAKPKTTKGE